MSEIRLGNRPFRNLKTYTILYNLIKNRNYESAAKKWFTLPRTNYNNDTLSGRITNKLGGNVWYKFYSVKNARKKRMTNFMNEKLGSDILNYLNSLSSVNKRGNYIQSRLALVEKLQKIMNQNPTNKIKNKIRKRSPSFRYNNLIKNVRKRRPNTRNVSTQVTPSNIQRKINGSRFRPPRQTGLFFTQGSGTTRV